MDVQWMTGASFESAVATYTLPLGARPARWLVYGGQALFF